MTTFIEEALRLAREFRKQFAKTKKAPRPHPMTWQKIKALWLLVRTAGRRFEPPPPRNGSHYTYTPDLRMLQLKKFHTIAGSNAPPTKLSSTQHTLTLQTL